jgi:hypothetical protein
VWELDRLVRSNRAVNPEQADEQALVLMHLRDFANPEGTLPADFDSVVRESFGELLESSPVP